MKKLKLEIELDCDAVEIEGQESCTQFICSQPKYNIELAVKRVYEE